MTTDTERTEPMAVVVRRHALRVLSQCGGNKARAAECLGVTVKTVYNWLERWERAGLVREEGGQWVER